MNARCRVLEIGGYPPPYGGWTMRIAWLKTQLEAEGHECVVLNIGPNRCVPNPAYETVRGAIDYVRKVWRFSRAGFVLHTHINGESPKGILLAAVAEVLGFVAGTRSVVTFHAGAHQELFPRARAPFWAPAYWLIFFLASKVICNSSVVKRLIVDYGVNERKVVPIPAFTRQYLEVERVELPTDLEAFLSRFPRTVFVYTRMLPAYFPDVLIAGLARIASARSDTGFLLLGVSEDRDDEIWRRIEAQLRQSGLLDRIYLVPDDDHALFLTLMTRSDLYLRTHIADGVASSVLEALALGVPVVACDNGARPAGVITFKPQDSEELADRVLFTLAHRQQVVDGLVRPEIQNTLADEVALLEAAAHRSALQQRHV